MKICKSVTEYYRKYSICFVQFVLQHPNVMGGIIAVCPTVMLLASSTACTNDNCTVESRNCMGPSYCKYVLFSGAAVFECFAGDWPEHDLFDEWAEKCFLEILKFKKLGAHRRFVLLVFQGLCGKILSLVGNGARDHQCVLVLRHARLPRRHRLGSRNHLRVFTSCTYK